MIAEETIPRPTRLALLAFMAVTVGLPVFGLSIVVLLWRPPTTVEIAVSLLMYSLAGLGISMGWHRLFTHRGFECSPALRVLLAIAGSMAFEGSLASWVANHRMHHAHTDRPGDPHSPWISSSKTRGFLHAHMGWLLTPGAPVAKFARDISTNRALAMVSRFWWVAALAGLFIPALVAGLLAGLDAFWGMLAFAGLLRVVLFHHVTWSVNSICHLSGSRRFETQDHSGNVAWLALFSFGESWHNNHHAHPRSARHGVVRGQLDPTAALLRLLEILRLVRSVAWPTRLQR